MDDFIGVRDCVTHHHACDCREAKFAAIEAENGDIKERIETIKDLAGMYESLYGTDKETPWVRSMMSILGQAEQALKGGK